MKKQLNRAQRAALNAAAEAAYDRGDFGRAVALCRRLAAGGEAQAWTRLGCCYELGLGVAPNEARARRCWQRGAARGDTVAAYCLASHHEGRSHWGRARRWYERAARAGDGDAQSDLARLLINPAAGWLDYGRAVYWFDRAAAQGDRAAAAARELLRARGLGE